MKTLNTTSEFKASEKGFGFNPKIRVSLTVDGLFNIPADIKKLCAENANKYSMSLYFLGQKFEGGKFVQRKLTAEEVEEQQAEQQAQAKKKGKDALAFEDTDPSLPDDLNKEALASYFEELENEQKFSSVKFINAVNGGSKFEEDLREMDLILFEEVLFTKQGANMYLVIAPVVSDEENQKKPAKGNSEQFTPKIFTCYVNLQSFRTAENCSIKDRYFLTQVNSTSGQSDIMYLKLELKTDVSIFHEFKPKFNFEITEILKRDEKILFPLDMVEQRFSSMTKTFYDKFSNKFNEAFANSKQEQLINGINGLGSTDKTMNLIREIADTCRQNLQKENVVSDYKHNISHLIASHVFHKYKIKDFKGVYFNNNDQIYGEMFSLFSSMFKRFGKEHVKEHLHDRGLSIPQNSLIISDYIKALESGTNMPAAKHFEELARAYWLLGMKFEAEKTIERVLSLDPKNSEALYFKIYVKLSKKEYNEAEALIVSANQKWGQTFEANYRLLLFFIERLKIKEAVFFLRYMLEKFPKERLFYSWLWILGQKYLESSSLTAYFQSKINRVIAKSNPMETQKLNQPFDEAEVFRYDFFKMFEKNGSFANPVGSIISPRTNSVLDRSAVPNIKLLAESSDNFFLKEARLALSWGFCRAASMMLEPIDNKASIDFKVLEYQIAKADDSMACLEKLNDLHMSPHVKNPVLVYETLEKLVDVGFVSTDDEDELLNDLFANFDLYQEPQQHFISFQAARIFFNREQISEASQIILRSLERWPLSVPQWILLGKCLYFEGNYRQALEVLSNANLLDNLNYEVLVLIACCLLKIGDKCRLHPVLYDLRCIGVDDELLTMTLIKELENSGYVQEANVFKRHYFAVHNAPSN
jgi:tetratricopeptide (TPR) repeat protein